jgi:hypothetical protein
MKESEGDTTVSYLIILKTQWNNLFYTMLLRPMLSLLRTQINVLERTLLIVVTKQALICALCTTLWALKVPVKTQVDSNFLCL